ncbi:hypothetical protein ACET3Z_008850 [Daucus carota]
MVASDDVTDRPLTSEAIPTIDLRLLSQSELFALSLCSSSALNSHQNDAVIPKINPTVFNKSAASRKQTYTPVRLAPRLSSRRRTPHPHAPTPASPETERAEDSKIISALTAIFNKSAASSKQTYVRRRLSASGSRRRTTQLRVPKPESDETESAENSKIVSVLKDLLSKQADGNEGKNC